MLVHRNTGNSAAAMTVEFLTTAIQDLAFVIDTGAVHDLTSAGPGDWVASGLRSVAVTDGARPGAR